MGRRYSNHATVAIAAAKTHNTIYQFSSGVVSRPRVYDLLFGFGGVSAPNDASIQINITRTTTAPTVTSVTPLPLDAADVATEIQGGSNASVEGTGSSGVALMTVSMNQRITFRWVAAPLSELVIPATANYGLAAFVAAISSGTPSMDSTIFFEQ